MSVEPLPKELKEHLLYQLRIVQRSVLIEQARLKMVAGGFEIGNVILGQCAFETPMIRIPEPEAESFHKLAAAMRYMQKSQGLELPSLCFDPVRHPVMSGVRKIIIEACSDPDTNFADKVLLVWSCILQEPVIVVTEFGVRVCT